MVCQELAFCEERAGEHLKLGIVVDTSVKGGVIEMVQALLANLPAEVKHIVLISICEFPSDELFSVPKQISSELIWIQSQANTFNANSLAGRSLLFGLEYPFLNLLRSIRFKRLLQNTQLDYLICVNGGMPGSRETLSMLRAANSLKLRASLWVHSMFSERSFLSWFVSRAYISQLFESCSRVVVPSIAVSNSIPAWAAQNNQILVAPNFLHDEIKLDESEADELLRIACPAAYYPNKGQVVLLEAAESLAKMGWKFRISFYGDGGDVYKRKLARLASELGVSEFVDFYGFTKKTDVYSTANLVVLPSTSQEAFGLAVLESMSLGIPVIASQVGGIPELFEPSESIALVEPGNSAALAERIASFLRNGASIAEEGKRMRANYLARHQPSSAARNLLAALDLEYAHSE